MKKIYIIFSLCFLLSVPYVNAQTMVTFYTTMGNFEAEMYETVAPITAGNFISLVNAKFYDGIIFHRVIDGFMIQGGDPLGTGYGGPGYTIPDEFGPGLSNLQKVISMANAGPNTGGSQFFINLVDNIYLDGSYPVFGMVTTGFDIVQAIGSVPTNASDKPLTDVVMDSVRVTFDPLGIADENMNPVQFSVFPNPVTDESVISINIKEAAEIMFSVYNQTGEKIYNVHKELRAGLNELTLKEMQISEQSGGIYYIAISDGTFTATRKIFVAR